MFNILDPLVLYPLLGVIVASIVSATVGSIMVTRGITFLSAEVAHAALGGAALSVLLQVKAGLVWFNPLLGAFLFGIISALFTGYAGEKGFTGRMEAAIGVSLALSMALAVLFLSYIPSEYMPKVWGYLIGDILLLSVNDVLLLGMVSLGIAVLYAIFYREFIYLAFDIEGAEAAGLNVRVYHYLSLILVALGTVIITKALGAILVYAFLIAPAASASELTKNALKIPLITFVTSLTFGIVGLMLTFIMNIPASGVIGLLAAIFYLFIMLSKIRKG